MELYKKKILSRICDKNDYMFIINDMQKYYSLSDTVIYFFNGIGWNIIHCDDMLAYPILYFDYWLEKEQKTVTNTLVVCPLTMRCIIYKGIIKIIDIVGDQLHLYNVDTNDTFFINNHTNFHIKRFDVKMSFLRECYTVVSDPQFILINNKKKSIIKKTYYMDRLDYMGNTLYTALHPKSIVYIIQYMSSKTQQSKYIVLLGNDININTVSYSIKLYFVS